MSGDRRIANEEGLQEQLKDLGHIADLNQAYKLARKMLDLARKTAEEYTEDDKTLWAPAGYVFAVRPYCLELRVGRFLEAHPLHGEDATVCDPRRTHPVDPDRIWEATRLVVAGEDILGVDQAGEYCCVVPGQFASFLIELKQVDPAVVETMNNLATQD